MRIWMTGGTGFVGSNIVHEAVAAGHDVLTTVNSTPPSTLPCRAEPVDMTDGAAVARSVGAFVPDVIVHCAILNDHDAMVREPRRAWAAYVDATRATAAAAQQADAAYVLVSTDWVFDGTGHRVPEDEPPNPVNQYGMLKMASELVALERGGAVARVSGVNGVHRARRDVPRAQDPGFGYFVASLVDRLRAGRPFTVWESEQINMVATPSLASECGEIIVDIGERGATGIFHCCGADALSRLELAHLACEVFDLDPSLIETGPPDVEMLAWQRFPYDTSLSTPRTDDVLARTATPARTLLTTFRTQYDQSIS